MPVIHQAAREVEIKIVYYGAAFAGKTTSLKSILALLPDGASELTALEAGPDRTLFFDCAPPLPVLMDGFSTRVRVWTVPGESQLNAPRELVLRDVDGIVFVVDPQWARVRENIAAMDNLEQNLRQHRIEPSSVPLVLQYNKTDLPHPARRDYLEYVLNRSPGNPHPSFESVATAGENLIPCLERVLELVLDKFWEAHGTAAAGTEGFA